MPCNMVIPFNTNRARDVKPLWQIKKWVPQQCRPVLWLKQPHLLQGLKSPSSSSYTTFGCEMLSNIKRKSLLKNVVWQCLEGGWLGEWDAQCKLPSLKFLLQASEGRAGHIPFPFPEKSSAGTLNLHLWVDALRPPELFVWPSRMTDGRK